MSYRNLNEDSPKITQPSNITIELMQHQKTSVHAMLDLENKGEVKFSMRYFDNMEKDFKMTTNIGILADKVGAGKTLEVLSLILEGKIPSKRPMFYESNKFMTLQDAGVENIDLDINVIVVPFGIQQQWIDAINTHIKKDAVTFINDTDELTIDEHKKCVVLCNEKTFMNIVTRYGDYSWSRLIIDEVDTIKLTTISNCNAKFVWLITGTTNGVASSNTKIIKEIFNKNKTWQPDFITVKNDNNYVDLSLKLPIPNRIIILCKTPYEVNLLQDHLPSNVINMINAGNTYDAIRLLNCHIDTKDNIFKVITKNYEMAIKNKEIELDGEKKKKYTGIEKNNEQQKRLDRINKVIKRLNERLNSIKKVILNANDDLCPICICEFEKPTMVDCCGHTFCFNCLTIIMTKTKNKCMFCDAILNKNKFHLLTNDNDDDDDDNDDNDKKKQIPLLKEKLDVLYDIVSKKYNEPNRKILIFSDYDSTFSKIEKLFKTKNINYGMLKGSIKNINNVLQNFREGKMKIILLNAKNFGAGMNLQCATDIVLFHRFTKEMEEQIIGRGQRLGRDSVLNVYYLVHSNEDKHYIDNNHNDEEYLLEIDDD